ncbi:MAG TPA: hypothetical protein VIQ31_32205 [Phormidium sp.]
MFDSLTRWEQYAPEAYDEIRSSSNDVEEIARNTGWLQFRIQRIKEHLFYRQHQLDDGVRCFDPDPDIADAWTRLYENQYNHEDIRLLEHEYFEARFEGIFRTNYPRAHKATLDSGRSWNPPPQP